MKKYALPVLCIIVALVLSACGGGVYHTTYTYQPPVSRSGKMCVLQCYQTKKMCQQTCQVQDHHCRTQAHKQAFYHYKAYHDRQIAQGKPVKRSINDFDDSFSVCHHTCSCTTDFNGCYQGCGGAVLAQKECTAFCK